MSSRQSSTYVEDPPLARFIFSDTRMAWFWLIVRVYLGYEWISSSLTKLFNPAWMSTGAALKGYWTNAVVFADGKGPIKYEWYRDFINGLLASESYVWFAKLVAIGEFAVGVALILGAFVGIAAFFGAFMNMNFMLAGSASSNPVLFTLAILIILAWKIAGHWGLDRFLLPLVGTPWKRGRLLGGDASSSKAT